MLHVTETIMIPDDELTWTFARAGGPGGQNVNKVASKAVLRWSFVASPSVPLEVKARLRTSHPGHVTVDGEFLVISQKSRDQERNRADCRDKLATMIARAAIPPTPRRPTKPTKGSKLRRLAAKKLRSKRKASRRGPAGD